MKSRLAWTCAVMTVLAGEMAAQELAHAPAVEQRDYLDVWPGYLVLPWTFKTPPLTDATADAYRRQGVNAIHVDRLINPAQIDWLAKHKFRFYLDHTAGKGYLYLNRDQQKKIIGRSPAVEYQAGGGLIKRPRCLRDPKVLAAMEELVRKHVAAASPHDVVFYALDDEISTGSFVDPAETCWDEHCQEPFRRFALGLYGGSLDRLNAAWGTSFKDSQEIAPVAAGHAVDQARTLSADQWNFARWADFRQFMDQTMMDTLVRLTRLCNELDPKRPCGFEGGQQPAPYGGYDYSRLSRAVQWIEAYDIGSNDEIARSLAPRAVRVKTFFTSKNRLQDRHRLWYHFAHGDRGAILWPADGEQPWWNDKAELRDELAHLPAAFKELTGPRLARLLAGAEFLDDGVAVYYSQPSLRAGWILDATVHRETWPARSGGIDRYSGSAILGRYAWLSLLEDAGLQYRFVDAPMLAAGELAYPRYKTLILPACHALGDTEAEAIRRFARAGGLVVADYLPGVLDEHCRSRGDKSALDDLFAVTHDWAKGLFDGKHATWIDGEKYKRPLAERLIPNVPLVDGWPVVERGIAGARLAAGRFGDSPIYLGQPAAKGRAVLLNLSPIPYLLGRLADRPSRHESQIHGLLGEAGVRPAVQVRAGSRANEVVRWRKDGRVYLCVVKNPQAVLDDADHKKASLAVLTDRPEELAVTVGGGRPAELVNERTGRPVNTAVVDGGWMFSDTWVPCEAAIYSYPVKSD